MKTKSLDEAVDNYILSTILGTYKTKRSWMKEVHTYSSLRQKFHQITHEYHSFKNLIVIADEDSEMQQLLTKILQQNHFIVLRAESGHDTLKLVQYQPQIIILDVYKPIHSLEVCRRLRRTIRFSNYHNIPIVIFSALLSKKNQKKILELGVDWIAKPTQMYELIELIYRRIPQTGIEMNM